MNKKLSYLMGFLIFLPNAAFADNCSWHGRFEFGQDGSGSAVVKSGQACTFHYTLSSKRAGMLKSLDIVSPPAHGKAGSISSSSFTYQSKAGYIGEDSFIFSVDGKDNVSSGLSKVTMKVSVR